MQQKNRWISILLCILLLVSCQTTNQTQDESNHEPVLVDPLQTNVSELTETQAQKLRIWLDTFYENDADLWQSSRKQILSLGPAGMEALCLFMVKFFFGGKQNIPLASREEDIGTYWERARAELVQLKGISVPYLVSAMAHPKMGATGKLQCSMTLVQIGQPAIETLSQNLERGNRAFRRIAIETLANIGDPQVVPAIANVYLQSSQPSSSNVELEDDPTFDIRYYSIKALGKLQATEGLATLEKALDDSNTLVVEQAIQALLMYEDPSAIPTLQKAYSICQKGKFLAYSKKIQKKIANLDW